MGRLLLIVALVALGVTALGANVVQEPRVVANWSDFVIEKHWPEYPFYARGYGYNGEGKYRLEIDLATGKVVAVTVLKSTTHKILDDSAIAALRRWRFRPHVASAAIVPVTFTIQGRPSDEVQRLAVYSVEPDLPVTWHHGSGAFRFIVDYETGNVTDVRIVKSTGLPSFDEAVVKAYRQWRFPPHKIRSIDKTVVVRPSWF